MRADNKDWVEPEGRDGRGRGRRKGACFTRVEAVARAISFSCTPVTWWRWVR